MKIEYTEAVKELHTIKDVLRWGMTQFNQSNVYYGHGTDNPWDEALQIVLHNLHLPYDVGDDILDCVLTHTEKQLIIEMFDQRIIKRVPVPYLTQKAWFAGLEFFVDERVIIPRSPIAELLEHHFQPWIPLEHVHHILDLCTGSGCIAIAAAHYFPHADIDAVDISADAIAVSQLNANKHEVEHQVHFIQSDLFDNLPNKQYDVIVSNPPYVDAEDMANLPDEFHHEPSLALAAGTDGLDLVDRILSQALSYLSKDGVLIVEVGNSAEALTNKYPHLALTWLEFERGGEGVFVITAAELARNFGKA